MERLIGRYQIEKVLGKGAMGKVYLAFDPVLERHVALKTIRVDRLDDDLEHDAFIERFFREARICGKLHHPGAVTVHDLGSHDDEPFIVMEYISGIDLATRMREPVPLDRDELLTVIEGMADTLDAAHALGIIHRDIKPQNVMLTDTGQVKILDFGIAKVAGADLTAEGVFWGTPAYAAPEQLSERTADKRADIYAFAVLLHRLLTGHDIFEAENIKKLFYMILHEQPRLAKPYPHLGMDRHAFHEVMRRALAKEPDARYPSAGDLRDALRPLFGTAPVGEAPVGRPADAIVTDDIDTTRRIGTEAAPLSRAERLRMQFQQALAEQNLTAARHLLRGLERLHVAVDGEKHALQAAETAAAGDRTSVTQRLIHHKKEAFAQQLAAGDLDAAQAVLQSLSDLEAPTDAEQARLTTHRREREELAQAEWAKLEAALTGGRLGSAKVSLRRLQRLGEMTDEAADKVKHLETEQMHAARTRMQHIVHAREQFQDARREGLPQAAEQALQDLQTLGAFSNKEETQMAELAAQWVMEHPDVMQNLHIDLKEALGHGDLHEAQDLVKRLSLFSGEEDADLKHWKKRLDAALAKQRRRTVRTLLRAFEEAIADGDHPHTREIQLQLAELGEESDLYFWLLQKAEGKDPGPRPGSRRRRLVIAAAVCAAALTLALLLR